MKTALENPSAFPCPGEPPVSTGDPRDGMGYGTPAEPGMTLRDYFAAAALTGLLAGQYRESGFHNLTELPEEAFKIADAMLSERSKQ